MDDLIYKDECYKIVGLLYEVHKNLGKGFSEIVYKDALELEFNENNIHYEREKEYSVSYKNSILKHKFYADFIIHDKIILEIKTVECFNNSHYNQCLNYLKNSGNKLAILVNFNLTSLEYKRIVDTKK
ncbi:GxxExxY protein [Flavobacterium sp. LS1R10]|uniref:GxxExxY protein n=1 Tax=Flavobacterium sp. LS1R10 TaxID=2497482 RepID=UPI000F81F811|nr:GxxExxY protein [Flavobacterium sp. LS1R10]RTY74645.1 GxxExxY protein [Flavobacterium sp. LS1R10]